MKKVGKFFLGFFLVVLVLEIVGVTLRYFARRIPPHTVLA